MRWPQTLDPNLDIHLFKEDTHLHRIVRERISVPDQGKAVGIMAAEIPPKHQPEFVAWLCPLIGHDDRENMLRIQQMVLPPEAFAGSLTSCGRRAATTGRS